MNPEYRRILLESFVILVLGMMVGLSVNYRLVLSVLEEQPVPGQETTDRQRFPQPAGLVEVRELLAAGALPVDARAAELYREGHLPQARSLPLGRADELLDGFRREISADRTIIAYCSGYGCPDSFDLAVRLLEQGYRDVRVFEGGLPEWRDAGLPVEQGRE